MSRFYVISPNVENDNNTSYYIDLMFKEHSIKMGWEPSKPKGQIFDNMKVGDYIICAQGSNSNKKVYFAGKIASENSKNWPYTRKLSGFVDLRNEAPLFSNDNAYGAASLTPAIYELKKNNQADREICKYIQKKVDHAMDSENLNKIKEILLSKKNIILQGAPGTGKTYSTAELALNICDVDTTSMNREKLMKDFNKHIQSGQIAFVTFHQTMDYEDFIEGLKPQVEDGNVTYEVEDGIFKQICQNAEIKDESNFEECYEKLLEAIENQEYYPIISSGGATIHVRVNSKRNLTFFTGEEKKMNGVITKERIRGEYFKKGASKAWAGYVKGVVNKLYAEFGLKKPSQSEKKNYVLIIDEINRGNVSKIFGELITLLEKDKRNGMANCIYARLPYSKELFSVPENLYIIGTMNTTDRSVGSIDYAIRRRFAFCTLESSWEIAERTYHDETRKAEAASLYSAVGNYIKQTAIDMDYEDLMVGHSYFIDDGAPLTQKWEYEILPLLYEYFKDGICSKDPLDGIRKKNDGKAERSLYMKKFTEKYLYGK